MGFHYPRTISLDSNLSNLLSVIFVSVGVNKKWYSSFLFPCFKCDRLKVLWIFNRVYIKPRRISLGRKLKKLKISTGFVYTLAWSVKNGVIKINIIVPVCAFCYHYLRLRSDNEAELWLTDEEVGHNAHTYGTISPPTWHVSLLWVNIRGNS